MCTPDWCTLDDSKAIQRQVCYTKLIYKSPLANVPNRKCRHTREGLGLSRRLSCSVSHWLVTASLSNSSLGGACACGAAVGFHTFPSSTKIRSSWELLSALGHIKPGPGAHAWLPARLSLKWLTDHFTYVLNVLSLTVAAIIWLAVQDLSSTPPGSDRRLTPGS